MLVASKILLGINRYPNNGCTSAAREGVYCNAVATK
jgi:hypothetical protein